MQVGSVTVSNIKIAEMIGAKAKKPVGPFILVRSKMGGYRYWEADLEVLKRKWPR